MDKTKVCILGAGIGGLTSALFLAKKPNIECTLVDQNQNPGGRLHSVTIEGNTYDIGALLLVPEAMKLFHEQEIHFKTIDFTLDVIVSQTREKIKFPVGTQTLKDLVKYMRSEIFSLIPFLTNIALKKSPRPQESVETYLSKIKTPSKILTIIYALYALSGVPLSLIRAQSVGGSGYAQRLYYPLGGTSQIPNQFLSQFLNHKGTYAVDKATSIDYDSNGVNLYFESKKHMKTDYLISNLGMKTTLSLLRDRSKYQQLTDKVSQLPDSLPITTFLYNYKGSKRPQLKTRSSFCIYLPYDNPEAIEQFLVDLWNKRQIIGGFCFHFPSVHDRSLSKTGEYPMSIYCFSPKGDVYPERYIPYLEEEIDKYILKDFSKQAELVKIISPQEYKLLWGNSPGISPIAPIYNRRPFNNKLSKRIFLAGANINFSPPSLVNSMRSGLYTGNNVCQLSSGINQ